METATLTSTASASHVLIEQSCRRIFRNKRRAPFNGAHGDRLNVPVNNWQIEFGSVCIQNGSKGSRLSIHPKGLADCPSRALSGLAGNSNTRKPHNFLAGACITCNARLYPQMLSQGRRISTLGFPVISVSVACSDARFCGEGDDDFGTNIFRFYTHISTGLSNRHRWLQSPSRIMSAACRGSSGDFISGQFGPYPWDPSWNASDSEVEWIQEDIVTLFTTNGLIQIGGSLVPRRLSPLEKKQSRGKSRVRYRRVREEDYMDPKQGLCLGAIFDIVATNGLDSGRRFCVFGFCRSIEMLSDVVEDTVLEQGGEVVVAAKGNWGGLNEKLSMRVAVPLLWGVPPAIDTLNYAIRCGGGIVEKVSCQWEFL